MSETGVVVTALMVTPWLLGATLGMVGRRLGRLLPPANGTRLLAIGSVATALACGFVATVAAFLAAAQLPLIAQLGRWSRNALVTSGPMPWTIGAACAAGVAILLLAALRRAGFAVKDLVTAALTCRRLGPDADGLVIVPDSIPDAYALPGLGGKVVVSTAMMQALSFRERRALLAHEESHLRHHHHLYVVLAELGAAANPLLRPLVAAVTESVERWADEDAAAAVRDRTVTAHALARASLARSRAQADAGRPALALAAGDSSVVFRTRALLDRPPRPRRSLALATGFLVAATVGAALATAQVTEHRFEQAAAHFHTAGQTHPQAAAATLLSRAT